MSFYPYMLTKRIIPCLDVDRGRVVKGVNFLELRDAGDPVEVARRYEQDGADELVFLDNPRQFLTRDATSSSTWYAASPNRFSCRSPSAAAFARWKTPPD